MLAVADVAWGAGIVGGNAVLDGHGNSHAQMLRHGNGERKLFTRGRAVSTLLADLSGLQSGEALLFALQVPNRTTIHCLATDFVL